MSNFIGMRIFEETIPQESRRGKFFQSLKGVHKIEDNVLLGGVMITEFN